MRRPIEPQRATGDGDCHSITHTAVAGHLQKLLGYFADQKLCRAIFSPTQNWRFRLWNGVQRGLAHVGWRDHVGPRYSSDAKLDVLRGQLLPSSGNLSLAEVAARVAGAVATPPHLLIVGFDFDRERATFFRSAPIVGAALGTGERLPLTLAEAIHASTNAPLNYFDGPARFRTRPPPLPRCDYRYWDGGITGFNNPVLAAVTEAIQLGAARSDIVALSLGTGKVARAWRLPGEAPSPYTGSRNRTGMLPSLNELATAILDDPPDMASFLAHVMISDRPTDPDAPRRLVRMNPLVAGSAAPGRAPPWQAPGGMTDAAFTYLAGIDMDAVAPAEVQAIRAYTDLWLCGAAPNQPIRMDGDTLRLELGSRTFPEALNEWRRIR